MFSFFRALADDPFRFRFHAHVFQEDRKRHARPQAAAREAVRILRRRVRRNTILPRRARGRAVRVALEKMSAGDGRKPLQIVHGKDQRLIHQAVNQEMVLGGIDIGRLVPMSDHEVKRGGSDVADRVLNRIPPPEVAVIYRQEQGRTGPGRRGARISRIASARRSCANPSRALRTSSGHWSFGPGGLRHPDGQTGQRGAIFQKTPAAGIFRFHEFLLWNA